MTHLLLEFLEFFRIGVYRDELEGGVDLDWRARVCRRTISYPLTPDATDKTRQSNIGVGKIRQFNENEISYKI